MNLFFPVADQSHVSQARRLASAAARGAGLDANDVSHVALVVTEAAGNILKHAGSGELVISPEPGDGPAVTILALDKGPGMSDVAGCLRDGFSTAGSPGTGLGAIYRASSRFEICSGKGIGTALFSRVGAPEAGCLARAEILRPHPGETACGDAVFFRDTPKGALVSVTDGLGHGPEAARASGEALGVLDRHAEREPAALLGIAHDVLHSTRGASMAIARVDLEARRVRFAAVGNISSVLGAPGGVRNLLSHPGTLGHEIRKIQELDYPWKEGAVLVMHSDGIDTHWHFDACPGLVTAHPALIAGVLYRDHCRGRDDVSIIVVRERHA